MDLRSSIRFTFLLSVASLLLFTGYVYMNNRLNDDIVFADDLTEESSPIDNLPVNRISRLRRTYSSEEMMPEDFFLANLTTDEIQDRRQKLMAEVCAKRHLQKSSTRFIGSSRSSLFAEPRLRYIYCRVPKVSCSSWKLFLAHANGLPETTKLHVHDPKSGIDSYVPPFTSFPPSKRREMLKTHFKFLFVRHPIERLVSAHRNKFTEFKVHKNSRYANIFKKASKLIKKRHRKRGTPWEIPVTFREFVAFLLDKRTKRPFDRHWQPMHEQCDPCRIRYDFIGHYETLKADILSVRSHLDIPDSIPFPKIVGGIRKSSRRNSSALIIQAMSQLTARQRVRIRQLYKLDFELFGYR